MESASGGLFPPHFTWVLPMGLAIYFYLGISSACVVLQTLHLAEDCPHAVLLMPVILKRISPAGLSGAMLGFMNLVGGIIGCVAGKLTDMWDVRQSCIAAVLVTAFGALFAAWTPTYIIGCGALAVGAGWALPLFIALYTCQFEDEDLKQRYVLYFYSCGNFAFFVGTLVAGIQPYWMGYVECAVLLTFSCVRVMLKFSLLKSSSPEAQKCEMKSYRAEESHKLYGYGVLCVFTLLFWVMFNIFLGGPFMLFAKKRIGPLGSFHIPPQWFLSFNGLVDILMGVPLAWVYATTPVRFHVKLRLSFLLMFCGFALVTVDLARGPDTMASPALVTLSILLISLGELHYNPVMLAAIPVEVSQQMAGFLNGIHFLLGGVGGALAGFAVPLYVLMEPCRFFMAVTATSAVGAIGLQLSMPFLRRCFDSKGSLGECTPLQSGGGRL